MTAGFTLGGFDTRRDFGFVDNVVFLAGTGDGIIPVGDDRKTVFEGSVYGVDLSINMIIMF